MIVTPQREDVDRVVARVFMKAIELLGGPRRLVEYRRLTWLPSLMEACYAVVLREMFHWTEDRIAEELGVARQTIRNILTSDVEVVRKRLSGELEEGEFREHVAGGLAKMAWDEVKRGRDELEFFIEASKRAIEAVEGPAWAVAVLTSIRGLDFPVDSPRALRERLSGLSAYGLDLGELAERLDYPVRGPADLLRGLSRLIRGARPPG